MFRLAHLSDVHLGPLPPVRLRDLRSKRMTGYANWRGNRARSHRPDILARLIADIHARTPDHIALTGDLINIGLEAEIVRAARWLKEFGSPEHISVVCGNHDAYVRGALESALRQWQAYVAGDNGAAVSGRDSYPLLRRRGNVSLILCNSAEPTPPFMATGYFRDRQSDGLARLLEQEGEAGQARVVLIHHPPVKGAALARKRLIGQSRFRACVRAHGAELVLHGHTHVDSLYHIEGPAGPVPVVGVPSAAQSPVEVLPDGRVARQRGVKPAARYNLFALAREGADWRIGMQEYGFKPGDGQQVELIGERQLV